VYENFVGPIPDDMVVDHVDNNHLNNHYSNLQLLTRRENTMKDFSNFQIKYRDSKIDEFCKDLSSGIYWKDVADRHNVNYRYMLAIAKGKTRKDVVNKYLPFPESCFTKRYISSEDMDIITGCVLDGKHNSEIIDLYPGINKSTVENWISAVRNSLSIRDPMFYDIDMIERIRGYIVSGRTNKEILSLENLKWNKSISWLLGRERQRSGVPNNNNSISGLDDEIRTGIHDDIRRGLSNMDIIGKYNLERTQQIVDFLGRSRYKLKHR
jgi:hypothetical protein